MTSARDRPREVPAHASLHHARTVHIRFENSYVTVDAVVQVIRPLVSSIAPMLAPTPSGVASSRQMSSMVRVPSHNSQIARAESLSDAAWEVLGR